MKNKATPADNSPLTVASKNPSAPVLKLLNLKREPLTPDVLKSFPSYEHLSGEEAESKCTSLQVFARLLFEHIAAMEKRTSIDNQLVISLDSDRDSKIIAINSIKSKPKAA